MEEQKKKRKNDASKFNIDPGHQSPAHGLYLVLLQSSRILIDSRWTITGVGGLDTINRISNASSDGIARAVRQRRVIIKNTSLGIRHALSRCRLWLDVDTFPPPPPRLGVDILCTLRRLISFFTLPNGFLVTGRWYSRVPDFFFFFHSCHLASLWRCFFFPLFRAWIEMGDSISSGESWAFFLLHVDFCFQATGEEKFPRTRDFQRWKTNKAGVVNKWTVSRISRCIWNYYLSSHTNSRKENLTHRDTRLINLSNRSIDRLEPHTSIAHRRRV